MSLDQVEEQLYVIAEDAMPANVLSEGQREAITSRAYLLAQKRGFAPGHELDDWLEAEEQLKAWNVGCACDTSWS